MELDDLQHVVDELKGQAEKFDIACSAAGIGMWEFFPDSGNMNWDSRMFELYGVDPDSFDANYENWRKFVFPDDQEKMEKDLQEILATGRDVNTFFRIIHPDKSIHYIRVFGRYIKPEGDTPAKIVGINSDITYRKEVETALCQSENRFRSLFNSVNVGISIHQPDERGDNFYLVDINQTGLDYFGLEKEHVVGKEMREAFPNLEVKTLEIFKDVYLNKSYYNFPVKKYKYNNEEIWFKSEIYALHTGELVVLYDNITEKMKIEEQLELKSFSLEHMAAAAGWVDESGKFSYVNDAICRNLGYNKEKIKQIDYCNIDSHVADCGWSEFWSQVKEKHSLHYQSQYSRSDASVYSVEVTATYIHYRDTELVCFFVVDISNLVSYQRKLEQKYQDLNLFNQTAVGRELRMIELKQEVNALRK